MRRTAIWFTMLVAAMATLSCGGYPAKEAAVGHLELPEVPEPETEKKPGTSFTPYLFELSGDWEYYPGLFLAGSEFSDGEVQARKTIIDFRDNYLRLGLRESPAKRRSFDYGTYRLTVSFPDSRGKRLVTRIPYFDMAVRVMAQGVTVFANGDVGTTRETTQPRLYYPVLVELPVVTDRLEIVLHVANFEYPDGGIRDTLVLGDLASMAAYNETQTYLEALIMGSLLLMALANLVLFIFLPDKKRPLYLMLLCLSTLSLMLVNGASILGKLGVEWKSLNRIHFLSVTFAVFFLGLFLGTLFLQAKRRIATRTWIVLVIPQVLVCLAAPMPVLGNIYLVHILLIGVILILSLYATIHGLIHGKKHAMFILASIVTFMIFYSIDTFELIRINQFNYASPLGVVLFTLLQIGIIANDIRTLNENLETQVDARTRELVEERRLIEVKVHEAVQKIQEKDDLISIQARQAATGELVDFIAHQWKQSLYAISLYSGSLRTNLGNAGRQEEPETREPLEAIDTTIKGMMQTMDEFRDFIAPTRQPDVFAVTDAIEGTLDLLQDMLSVNRITVETDLDASLHIQGYSNEFKQVLLNLVMNAKEAIAATSPERGLISIKTHRAGGSAVILVKDNGGGIPGPVKDRLFEKFMTNKDGGSGLGLYLSRMILERHFSGSIRTRDGAQGAIFTIVIPEASAV